MAKRIKSAAFFVLKVFGALLLGLFFLLFWQETLKYFKQRRFPLPYDKEKARKRKLWNEFFDLQKQRFYQRQEELREEFSKQIEQQRTQTNRKELK
jgi:hypothetical protein